MVYTIDFRAIILPCMHDFPNNVGLRRVLSVKERIEVKTHKFLAFG